MSFLAASAKALEDEALPDSFQVLLEDGDYSFQWAHFIDLWIQRDHNGRDHTVTITTSTTVVVIVGMTLQGLYNALRHKQLTSVWRDVTMPLSPTGVDVPFVRTITVNPRP